MYQICICDDEQEVLLQLSEKIKSALERLALEADYTLIHDARVLMEQIGKNSIDILFLDIDMPYHNGMDIAGYIKEQKLDIILVFVTSHDALVYRTFAYRPFAFLRKTCLDEDLVNPDYIETYKTNSLAIRGAGNGALALPVGRSYEKEVRRKIIESIR